MELESGSLSRTFVHVVAHLMVVETGNFGAMFVAPWWLVAIAAEVEGSENSRARCQCRNHGYSRKGVTDRMLHNHSESLRMVLMISMLYYLPLVRFFKPTMPSRK